MTTLLKFWLVRNFANEAGAIIAEFASGFANEKPNEEGWVELAPYGDWPNADGLQRFDKADAESMVNEFNTLKNLPQRVLGLPWYIGHPDHPRFAEKYKDTRAYGRIKQLEAREKGLFANVKWSADGRALLESEAFHGHSVNWSVRKQGAVWHPFRLKSVGFTNDPQIPVAPAMANENNQPDTTMPPWLKEMVVAMGLAAADATDDGIKSAVQAALKTAKDYPAEKTAMANEKAARETAEAKLAAATTDLTAKQTALATAETNLANERAAHAKSLLDAAEQSGRVKPADRAKWVADFSNEFSSTATRLAALQPEMKTRRTADVSGRGEPPSKAKFSVVQDLVNERMRATGESYDAAFTFVRKNKTAAFDGMKEPGTSS